MNPHIAFISAIHPFDRLVEGEMDRVGASLDLHYFPRDRLVQKSGEAAEYLYVVFKGVVRQEDTEGVVAILGPREFFDVDALLSGPCHYDYTVVEDALCYTVPRVLFLALARGNPSFQDYFFQNLGQKADALGEEGGCGDLNPLVTGRVKEVGFRPLLPLQGSDPIQRAAQLMREHQVDALLVRHEQGPPGMVTTTILRDAVAAAGFDPRQPVATIARAVAPTVARDALLFNAVLLMTRHRVSRLLVERNGEPQGFLELVDLLGHLANHAHLVVNQIDRATSVAGLRLAAERLPFTVANLARKGVKTHYVAQLMQEMNRRLLGKLFTLLAPPEIAAHAALVVMGSEGRGEQLRKTDQDNALLLRDGVDPPGLQAFRQEMGQALVTLGFPPCPGGVMLTEDAWCAPVSRFQERVRGWIETAEPDALMQLAIFYDAQAVAGDRGLLRQARKALFVALPDSPAFYARFALPTLAFATPLGLFSRLLPDDEGLDIKKGGIFPMVHGIRSLALEKRLREVNTSRRIRALARLGVLETGFANDLVEAFDFMSGLRLLATRAADDDRIDPARLSAWQRELLKDSLRTVNRLKKQVAHHFQLNLLG